MPRLLTLIDICILNLFSMGDGKQKHMFVPAYGFHYFNSNLMTDTSSIYEFCFGSRFKRFDDSLFIFWKQTDHFSFNMIILLLLLINPLKREKSDFGRTGVFAPSPSSNLALPLEDICIIKPQLLMLENINT